MTENRFFTWVWRFNGLLIALVATLLLCILLWELTRDLRRSLFPTQTSQVITATPENATTDAPTETVAQNARFGAPEDAASGGIYALPQYVDETYRSRGISKESGGNRVNYLIVNTADQTSTWLFEGRSQLITDVRVVMKPTREGRRAMMGHLLKVIEKDTNGNGQLSYADLGVLYFVPPDWSTPVRLRDGVTRMLTVRTVDDTTFEVIALGEGTTTLHRYSLPDGAEAFAIPLPAQN